MTNHERRNSIALDEAYYYCRRLETKAERPEMFTLCNAIRTLDLALQSHDESPMPLSLCTEAWSRVRDSLFNFLVCSFPGYFEIFDADDPLPVTPGNDWPEFGTIDFYPESSQRKVDSYAARLDRLSPSVMNPLRWAFADGRQQVAPVDFDDNPASQAPVDSELQEQATEFLARLYEVCEEEASEGKKKAHRKWWQLYWEADSCPNKREKHELQKQMVALQSIWGRPRD